MIIGVFMGYLWVCAFLTNDSNPESLDVWDGVCIFSYLFSFLCVVLCILDHTDGLKTYGGLATSLCGALTARTKNSNVGVVGNALLFVVCIVSMFR